MPRPKADRIDQIIDWYLAMDKDERNELMGALRGVDRVEARSAKRRKPDVAPIVDLAVLDPDDQAS